MGESLLKSRDPSPIKKGTNLFHIGFERENRNSVALTYAHLIWVDFNASVGITLHFSSHTVTLRGGNLRTLYDQILLHEVAYVSSQPSRFETGEGDSSEPTVTSIHVMENKGDAERFGMGTPVAEERPDE